MTSLIYKNKKAMFFTLLAIALLSLFVISYTLYSIVQDREAINDRIETLNNFVFSVEKDLPRQLYISGFRIIFLTEKRIVETGTYVSNFSLTFEQAFFDGTLPPAEEELMNGARFSDIENSIQERAEKINAQVSFSSPSVYVTQEDPWNIKITLITDILIQDSSNLALWNKTETITTYVSVENFEDPFYVIGTNGKLTNKINKTIYPVVNSSNLLSHTQNQYYINSSVAPSFLNRLEGKTTANENGIESLVYLPNLNKEGIAIKEKSVVDYIYFSENNPSSQQVSGMPDWFRLDTEHLSVYGV